MPSTPDSPDVTRLLVDIVRDQGRVLAAIAEGVAVGADRQARIASLSERQASTLDRLDGYLAREEAANAQARARLELGQVEERAALTRLYDTVRRGLASSTGQRVLQTIALAWLAWAGARYGFVLPAPGAGNSADPVVESPHAATPPPEPRDPAPLLP